MLISIWGAALEEEEMTLIRGAAFRYHLECAFGISILALEWDPWIGVSGI